MTKIDTITLTEDERREFRRGFREALRIEHPPALWEEPWTWNDSEIESYGDFRREDKDWAYKLGREYAAQKRELILRLMREER